MIAVYTHYDTHYVAIKTLNRKGVEVVSSLARGECSLFEGLLSINRMHLNVGCETATFQCVLQQEALCLFKIQIDHSIFYN